MSAPELTINKLFKNKNVGVCQRSRPLHKTLHLDVTITQVAVILHRRYTGINIWYTAGSALDPTSGQVGKMGF
jgi:hypothetical protein